MRIQYFQHVPFEGLGSIELWAAIEGHQVAPTRLYTGEPLPALEAFDWLIVLGGPMSVYAAQEAPWLVAEKRFLESAIAANKVVLGICLGAQILADVLGARVYRNVHQEIGWFPIETSWLAAESRLFSVVPSELEVFHWHGDTFDLPMGATHLARSAACANQAFSYGNHVLGLQFHLETTRQSAELLIQHCGEELVNGPYIQSAEIMLADPLRFQLINQVMADLLDQLRRVAGPE